MSKPTDLVQGTLDLLILKVIALEPMHGWAIAQRIRQMSGDVLQVGQGALYPSLHKLEQNGWISAEWAISENNRRAKYYTLTKAGRKALDQEAGAVGTSGRRRSRWSCGQSDGERSTCAITDILRLRLRSLFSRERGRAASSTRSCSITSNGRSRKHRGRHDPTKRRRRAALRSHRPVSNNGKRSAAICVD